MQNNSKESDVVTQFYFFKCLTDPVLNTLLHKVSSGDFESKIASKMENDIKFIPDNDIGIISEINMEDKSGPSIYISFYENKYRICHLTIHLCPTSFYSESKGPLHITNNTYYRATRRLRINKRNNNSILFRPVRILNERSLLLKTD